MNFFKPVYDGILKAFTFLKDASSIDFYAFIAFAIVAVSLIVGILVMIFCEEAKTARRLVKINNLLLKNKKQKQPQFFEKFTRLVTKGNNRVVTAFQGYVFKNNAKVSEAFKDSRLFGGYTAHNNFVKLISNTVALILFVLSVGILSTSTNVLEAIYQAAMFPLILVVVSFIYTIVFNISKKSTQTKLVEYSKAISESIDIFLVEEKENLANLKTKLLKELIDFADPEVLVEESEPVYNDRFLEDSAALEKEREKIRAQFNQEINELKERGDQLEEDIRKNREELLEVRNQIRETDDKTVITSLKQQEDSQLKLISALEKLKGAQQKQYIEIEAKLQTELKRIDETLSERRKSAEEKMKRELDEFADNLLVEKQKQLEDDIQPTTRVASKPVATKEPPKQNKKDINEALSNLLTAMNKYNDNDK